MKKLLFFAFALFLLNIPLIAQIEPDDVEISTVEYEELIAESPSRIELLANASVRFEENALVYLNWSSALDFMEYEVQYKQEESNEWITLSASGNEMTINNLPLNTNFQWKVSSNGSEEISDLGAFSTYPQSEPIKVSNKFYNKLNDWFSGRVEGEFCSFLDDVDVHVVEKTSLLQVYSFQNMPFTNGGNSNNLDAWLPPVPPSTEGGYCLPPPPPPTECLCKVITSGSVVAAPTGSMNFGNQTITPRSKQFIARAPGDKTFVDRFESGAAKFVSLRQDEGSGGMNYEMSNSESGTDDDSSITTASSCIQFFLGCMSYDGLVTNLPEGCDCERPLYVDYEYNAGLFVKAELRNCIWSKGAAAQAEDMAFVIATNQKTNETSVLAAGQGMVGRGCGSSWNPEFWTELLDVVAPALGLSLDTLTLDSLQLALLNQVIDEVQDLIGTPFRNTTGTCGQVPEPVALVGGGSTLTLAPNEPISICLYSSYYLRTRGFGCYRAEAGVASDYYLMGVVESEQTVDPQCCADKFAAYILGSLSTPPNGDVDIDAPNSIADHQNEVGFNLAVHGDWHGLSTNSAGLIPIGNEFGLLTGPSCIPQNPGGGTTTGDPGDDDDPCDPCPVDLPATAPYTLSNICTDNPFGACYTLPDNPCLSEIVVTSNDHHLNIDVNGLTICLSSTRMDPRESTIIITPIDNCGNPGTPVEWTINIDIDDCLDWRSIVQEGPNGITIRRSSLIGNESLGQEQQETINQIALIDLNGRVLFKTNSLTDDMIIPTNHLPAGVYILHVNTNFRNISKKIVHTLK